MSMNVLVVDDSDIIRRMISKTMRLADIPAGTVFEASNGKEALEVMDENWVDVVLADLNMPVMDGFEMIQRMRLSGELADIPVVVVSTEGAERRILELQQLGIAAYLRKPFTPEQVRDTLNALPRRSVDTRVDSLVEGVVCDVLERFGLVFGEALSDQCPSPQGEVLLGRAGMRGAVNGIVSVAAPLELCREMASNALGTHDDDDGGRLRAADAVGEVVNMVAGHVATGIDALEHTRVSPPVVTRIGLDEWLCLEAAFGTRAFDVEGRPLLASFRMRGTA